MNQQLADYILQQVKNGYTLSAIKDFLIKQGYAQNDVDEAISYVSEQRLAPIINYIKDSISKGFDQDTIKARLLAMGYQAPDINEALGRAQTKKTVQIPPMMIMILVALVILGLGLFFFWPKSAPVETAGPGITKNPGSATTVPDETEIGSTTPKFDTTPTVTPTVPEEPPSGQQPSGFDSYSGFNVSKTGQPAETPAEEQVIDNTTTAFPSETSEFEDLINKASKEKNVDNAINICKKTENVMYRDACYDQLSKSFDSSILCAKIEDQSLKDSCYMSIIMKNKDYALCGEIQDSSLKSSCESLRESVPSDGNMTAEMLADIPL